MKIVNYTEARLNLRATIDEVNETNVPTCITSKNNNQVVLVSKRMYDELVKRDIAFKTGE